MPDSDPFTIVYDAIWKLVEAFPPFQQSVRAGNKINFAGNARDPEKQTRRVGDMPEVSLYPSAGESNLCSTSSTSDITKDIVFTVVTGDKRVNFTHNQLQFYIIQALAQWKAAGGLGELTWKGNTFVEDANVTTITEGMTDEQLNKNIEGWASTITIQVRMRFAQQLLQEA